MTDAPKGLALPTRVLLTLAAASVAFAGLWAARELVGPVVLVIIAHPVRAMLERRGWRRWAATVAVIVVVYLILAALGLLLGLAIAQFARLVADNADAFAEQADALAAWVTSLGLTAEQTDAITGSLDTGTLVGYVLSFVSGLVGSLTAIVLVFAYVLFMAADAAYVQPLFSRFALSRAPVIAAMSRFGTGVRRYMVVNAIFGLIVAVIDGIFLAAIGVPGAFIWAVLAFITNFIPNVGFVIGVIPPAIMALLVGGWPLMLAVIAVYCIVNVTLQVLVQPRFVAVAVNLGFTVTFASVFFWSFVLGPLGALLAVPLTLLLKLLLFDADPRADWLRALSGDREEMDPSGAVAAADDAVGDGEAQDAGVVAAPSPASPADPAGPSAPSPGTPSD